VADAAESWPGQAPICPVRREADTFHLDRATSCRHSCALCRACAMLGGISVSDYFPCLCAPMPINARNPRLRGSQAQSSPSDCMESAAPVARAGFGCAHLGQVWAVNPLTDCGDANNFCALLKSLAPRCQPVSTAEIVFAALGFHRILAPDWFLFVGALPLATFFPTAMSSGHF